MAQHTVKLKRRVNLLALLRGARGVESVAVDPAVVEPNLSDTREMFHISEVAVVDHAGRNEHAG